MTTGDEWLKKAKALDRYRWLLLRERHGRLASALRFSRDALADLLFGLCARFRLAHQIKRAPCDFLLLQSAPKVIKFQRKKLLMERLRALGYNLRETALQSPKMILRQHQLKKPPQRVPLRYLGYAAYAEWIVEHHQPRVLLNDRNGSLYSPFLRLALTHRGRPLVHLAHATTVESSQRLGMNDYDYYFLFGQSSLNALQARKLRFGSSKVVLSGSHMIDRRFNMLPANPKDRVVLVLGVGPDKEKEHEYLRAYKLLRSWVAKHPEFKVLIKAHPRSEVPFWRDAAVELQNLHVLPSDCGLVEALEQSSVVFNIMSNAVIEAALARRALVFVGPPGKDDIFSQEQFLGERVIDERGLVKRLDDLLAQFPSALAQAEQFASYHLAHGVEGLEFTVKSLELLLADSPALEGFELQSSIDIDVD
ncbi:capsule biosynthesis protein [Pseudomonas saudiphocaensis]|uniref:capsule biosynthesis protein n=1 Tax=Pseudomonas saudiphocaensis TaxID=1499686 RepID=UPI00163A0D19|nr:capsule biosynthesis protein [Pseudomonas saudiphocaensis]